MTAIYDELLRERPNYQLPSAPGNPGGTMDLAAIEQDVRTRVQDFVTRAEEDVTRGREILDEHLPALVKEAEAAAKPLVAAAKALDLPDSWIPIGVSFLENLAKLAAASPAPAAPPAPQPLDDAQQAMADAAAPAQGPQVGGVA